MRHEHPLTSQSHNPTSEDLHRNQIRTGTETRKVQVITPELRHKQQKGAWRAGVKKDLWSPGKAKKTLSQPWIGLHWQASLATFNQHPWFHIRSPCVLGLGHLHSMSHVPGCLAPALFPAAAELLFGFPGPTFDVSHHFTFSWWWQACHWNLLWWLCGKCCRSHPITSGTGHCSLRSPLATDVAEPPGISTVRPYFAVSWGFQVIISV